MKSPSPAVVIAEHGHRDLEELVGVAVVAEQGGHRAGRHPRVGHEGIGEELDRAPPGDAAQDLPHGAIHVGQVVDKLAVLDPPHGVRGDEGVFVGCLAGSFDGADAGGGHARLQYVATVSVRRSWRSRHLRYVWPVAQRFRIEIGVIWPDKGMKLWIEPHLIE